MSIAFFCPHCGDIWGRVVRGPTWYTHSRNCERHVNEYQIGGSFFQNYDWVPGTDPFLSLHPRLLEHEFRVSMAWAERFPNAQMRALQGELAL